MNKAGAILGETDQKLWRVLFAHIEAAWRDLSWEDVVWVGADEMNRRKGHNYLTVFADWKAKRVLLAVEGKDSSVWERFAEQLLAHHGHPKAITQIAIDTSPAYIKGVKDNYGNANIVLDKFHVVSQVSMAVDEVRRKEVRQDAAAREQLEKTSWLWLKNPEGWIDDGVFGGSQQFVFGDQAQGAGISLHRISDRDALLCRRQVGGPIP